MKASLLGSDGTILTQLSALREGFNSLGHEHTFLADDTDTAFVFIGNPPFHDYLELAKHKKTIFNVLDLPFHVSEIDDIIERLKVQLPQASRVTCISQTVAAQLKEHCNVDAQVIYYPAKKVFPTGVRKYPQFKVMACGRLLDGNKFFTSAISALIRAGYEESEVAIVGPEYPGWGTRMNVVSDETLNDLYNSVDYVIMLDKNAGIGLPAIEGAMCGAIPILASHLATLDEFWVKSALGMNYQTMNSSSRIAELMISINDNITWKEELRQDMLGYSELFLRPKFDRKMVASRIVDVFHSI